MSSTPIQNFQTYISGVSTLTKSVQTGVKTLKGTGNLTSATITAMVSGYAAPVFTLLKQVKTYIPLSMPTVP